MAYKFQRGEAILSGALLQEGNIEIESGFEFSMHDELVLDTSRNLTVAGMSGSGNLEVGGDVRLDGVQEADAEATDRMYFLDADGLMKSDAIEDVRDFLIFDSVSGDATIAHGGALTIAAGAVENSMLSGAIANDKLVNDSVTVTAGAALSGGGEVELGASINLDVEVHGNGGIEIVSDALQIKEAGVTNAMLSGAIASGKIAELNAFDTDALSEGSSNLYFSDSRARGAISVTDNGGDGALGYDSTTGVISFTGPSADEVRAHFSTGYMIDLDAGQFSIDAAEFSGSWDAVLDTKTTDNLAEGSNLYFTDARARAAVSVSDAGGDGSLTYDSGSGVFTYTGPSASEVRAHLSVTDNGGDGALSYDSETGVISYTGPSAAEVRAHLSAGEMLQVSDGEFSIVPAEFSGSVHAALSVSDSNSIDMSYDAAGQFSADLRISGSQLEVTADGLRLAALAADGTTMELSDDSLSVIKVPHALSQGEGIAAFSFDGDSDVTISLSASVAGDGLAYSAGVLSLDLQELTDDAVAVADDFIAFVDADDNSTKKESIADLVAAMAGAGLTATSGSLSVTGNDVNDVANNDTLVEGYNYFVDAVPDETDWIVTLPASPEAGDVVHVKAQDIGNLAGIEIAVAGGTSHTIDGESFIILESPYAAVSLVYVASNDWRIV